MSHVVAVQTQVRDPLAIAAACRRLGLPEPLEETVTLFSGEAHGWTVRLPDWTYPVVCETETGTLKYDNFQGRWGDPVHLDAFLCGYAIEKVRIEARRKGYTLTEQSLPQGQTKLTIEIGAAT